MGEEHEDLSLGDLGIQRLRNCREEQRPQAALAEVRQLGLELAYGTFLGTGQGTADFIVPRKAAEMNDTCTGAKTCLKRMWLAGENSL